MRRFDVRRSHLKAARLLGFLPGLLMLAGPAIAAPANNPTLVASANVAVAHTRSGNIRGFVHRGVFTFRGVPYAAAERFMPPSEVEHWQGVRLALSYGNICPQPVSTELREPQTFISDTRYWPASEKCQYLNVWTRGIADGKRRPVMVWIHGGGFFSGSSNELPVYDGTNLAQKGDVVVVSINHRLNVLGFLDLSAYAEKYGSSANVGMLDIVAALQWVQDNIEQFGGDPRNITIFGQSGGGAKVATLMASPKAHGLFNKAIIESGAPGGFGPSALDQRVSRRVAELTLQYLGLTASEVDQLQAIPYDRLASASGKALRTVSDEAGKGGGLLGFPAINWSPVVDGRFLKEQPFGNSAPIYSKGVPLLVGSTLSEFGNFPNAKLRGHETWSNAEFLAYLRSLYGVKGESVLAAYRTAYPTLGSTVWPSIDTMMRAGVLRTARMEAEQGNPVYTYIFAWRSPVLDYAWAAGHSSEIGLVFDNPDAEEQALGGGAVVHRLATQMSSAWINFARTGNPNAPGLPSWPAYSLKLPATMVFDTRSAIRIGHDADLIRLTTPPQ